MHHFTCWTLFISGINRAWLYKGLSDSQRQPNSDLAQWQSMRLMIWRLWVQTPLGAIFDEIFFVLYHFRSVRTCIVKNSNEIFTGANCVLSPETKSTNYFSSCCLSLLSTPRTKDLIYFTETSPSIKWNKMGNGKLDILPTWTHVFVMGIQDFTFLQDKWYLCSSLKAGSYNSIHVLTLPWSLS